MMRLELPVGIETVVKRTLLETLQESSLVVIENQT